MSTTTIKARDVLPGRHALPQKAFGPAPVTRVEVVGPRTCIHYRWGDSDLLLVSPSDTTLVLVDLQEDHR